MAGDSMWAATYESPPLPPTTILGIPILQHPQPLSAQASSGIILPSHSAPTYQRPATAHPSTEPLPPPQPISSIEELRQSGISPYRPMSTHSSLYHLRNPSRAAQHSRSPTTAATGHMSSSSIPPPHRSRIHRRHGERITRQLGSEPQPPPELLMPPESRYYEYFTSETSGEGHPPGTTPTLHAIPRHDSPPQWKNKF